VGGVFQGGTQVSSGPGNVGVQAIASGAANALLAQSASSGVNFINALPPVGITQNGSAHGHLAVNILTVDPTTVSNGETWWITNGFKTRLSGVSYTVAPLKAGTVALTSGTPSTATVTMPVAGMNCTCTEATAAANNGTLKCAVASTTLTITGPNTVTDTISYTCLVSQ
jgi:hypothetical protein